MTGSTIGASADLLFMMFAAWMLAIPFLLTIAAAAIKGRSWVWPFGSAIVSAMVVVLTHDALMRFVLHLDVSVVVLVPIASGGAASLVVILVMWRLPPRTYRRRWTVVRLDREAAPGILEVNGKGLRISGGSGTVEVSDDALTAIEREHSVVRLRWRSPDGAFLSATLLPDPSSTSEDPGVAAELIVQRMRRLLPKRRIEV